VEANDFFMGSLGQINKTHFQIIKIVMSLTT